MKRFSLNNVILLGIVSMLVDFSTEMVYPLIPLYLTSTLGATPVIVGFIEGIAESLASLLKVTSGYVTDRYRNKKLFAAVGYSGAVVYKIALLFASSWAFVLLARVIDRLGKGIRTAPRDVLIAESAEDTTLGRSFGLHKMLDMTGSSLGIFAAYLLVRGRFIEYERIFLISAIPAVMGLCVLGLVKERRAGYTPAPGTHFTLSALDSRLKGILFIAAMFTLGNSSNAFLLLRAQSVGFDDSQVILLYFIFSAVAALLSYPFGNLSDTIGRKVPLVALYCATANCCASNSKTRRSS